MSEWISVKERLPKPGEYCWLYGSCEDVEPPEKFVFEGAFDLESQDFRDGKLKIGPGWIYDFDGSDYVMTDQVSHWMPYYTPKPPEES